MANNFSRMGNDNAARVLWDETDGVESMEEFALVHHFEEGEEGEGGRPLQISTNNIFHATDEYVSIIFIVIVCLHYCSGSIRVHKLCLNLWKWRALFMAIAVFKKKLYE